MTKFQKARNALAVATGSALVATSSFAAGPSAGDLSDLTPDAATLLTAIAAITVVVIGVNLAEKALPIIKRMLGKF